MGPSARFEVEDQLRIAVEQTKAAYEAARKECVRLKVYAADLGDTTHPADALAYCRALVGRDEALKQYSQALVKFFEFMLDR
jgi:hypothetical protein